MNSELYKEAFDKLDISKDFKKRTLSYMDNSDNVKINKKKGREDMKKIAGFGAVAAAIVLALGIGTLINDNNDNGIALKESTGRVEVSYVSSDNLPENTSKGGTSGKLVALTEEEVINNFSTSILVGTVVKLENIIIDFGEDFKQYKAIATIEVQETLRGQEKEGDVITILLPVQISLKGEEGNIMEDTDVISQIREGMTGIFMPMEYSSEDVYEMNDSVLVVRDIAKYGLIDGMRFTILETDKGLVYNGAFEGLKEDSSLTEAKGYIKNLIK